MYNPDPKRLGKLLSAVINLYKYREDKGAQWEEFEEESATINQQMAARAAANSAKVSRERALLCQRLIRPSQARTDSTPLAQTAELKRLADSKNAQLPVRCAMG